MKLRCPYCAVRTDSPSDPRTFKAHGSFWRTSDSKRIERYKCLRCQKTFSKATTDPCRGQKKRQKNGLILEHYASCVTQRRSARLARVNRKTVARKLRFLAALAKSRFEMQRASKCVVEFEFDDMETFEHSKCKPLSITLAVEAKTRRILGVKVARMAAKGRLTKKSLRLYGRRRDERRRIRRDLFKELTPHVVPGATIRSDSNPHYLEDVKRYFPNCHYTRVMGLRGAITGGGELKKGGFDPLFSLNHTAAMFRANVSRLVRKTWATTKKAECLYDHLIIYSYYHNKHLGF